jgi:hypothetical protein
MGTHAHTTTRGGRVLEHGSGRFPQGDAQAKRLPQCLGEMVDARCVLVCEACLARTLKQRKGLWAHPRRAENGATPLPSLQAQEPEASAAATAAVSREKRLTNSRRRLHKNAGQCCH